VDEDAHLQMLVLDDEAKADREKKLIRMGDSHRPGPAGAAVPSGATYGMAEAKEILHADAADDRARAKALHVLVDERENTESVRAS
jgi:hypothetical protein